MRSFFKVFFASLLSLMVFSVLCIVAFLAVLAFITHSPAVVIPSRSVLVVDLTKSLSERDQSDPFNPWLYKTPAYLPGLFRTASLIRQAADDQNIRGIYLLLGEDPNGLATGDEIRDALLDFRHTGKFIIAYGDDISQKSYYVATAASRIYLNPKGSLDFRGFAVQEMFLKGLLDKLEIRPQIFYDGKFKSATEPLRVAQMTDANRIQTQAFLADEFSHFLEGISQERKIDTSILAAYADQLSIRTAGDALGYHLVDGLRYDDQVNSEIHEGLSLAAGKKVSFVSIATYGEAVGTNLGGDTAQIAVIYADGDIVDGKGDNNDVEIAAGDYINLIRRVREENRVKAIVFRVNSPGGSALAAEEIWRELSVARQSMPVVVSMGDYAASGGYYISCMADSIFAEPGTLTGSIGVFGVIPDLSEMFKDKLGITFDGVKTSPYADMGSMGRPLTDEEKRIIQNSVDTTYAVFKARVTEGRRLNPSIVDSIAQGRVWTGTAALKIGLVDKLGNIEDAVACAARMAHLSHYSLVGYPEAKFDIRTTLLNLSGNSRAGLLRQELGDKYPVFEEIKSLSRFSGVIQARLPYSLDIE